MMSLPGQNVSACKQNFFNRTPRNQNFTWNSRYALLWQKWFPATVWFSDPRALPCWMQCHWVCNSKCLRPKQKDTTLSNETGTVPVHIFPWKDKWPHTEWAMYEFISLFKYSAIPRHYSINLSSALFLAQRGQFKAILKWLTFKSISTSWILDFKRLVRWCLLKWNRTLSLCRAKQRWAHKICCGTATHKAPPEQPSPVF